MFFKKVLSSILCLSMLFGSCISSFAAQITSNNSQDVVVTYGMDEGFMVTIPTDFTIGSNHKATADISATDVIISYGSVLNVSVSSNNYVSSWELVDIEESSNSLTYIIGSIDGASDIKNNSVVLSINSGEAYNSTITKTMYFEVVDELIKSGIYKDTLTFNVFITRNGGSNNEELILDVVGEISGGNVITLSNELASDVYTLKYENTDGILTNYADIASLEPGDSYDDLIDENIAPQQATKIGVYSSSGDRVGSIALSDAFKPNLGTKLYSFGALADTHISGDSTYDNNFANALKYFNEVENVSFVTIPGDLTDSFSDEQLAIYKNIVDTYSPNTPVYESAGNHDTPFWRGVNYRADDFTEYTDLQEILESATENPLYYSFTHGNDVFIMVGLQNNDGGRMFTHEELQWLYETLEENRNKRCFVFIHAFMPDGSGNVNGWYTSDTIEANEQILLESLFKHYQNVVFFHGHSHQQFEKQSESSYSTYMKQFGIHSIHIPSVSATKGLTSADFGKSQGYVVDVYDSGIVLRGMEFKGEQFLPIAQYYLDTNIQTIAANTYVDETAMINCEKAIIEWSHRTHVDKTTGNVANRDEYSSSNLISVASDKDTYFHTAYLSPYGLDICCYDENGNYLGYITISYNNNNLHTGPVKLNTILKEGTKLIRLRIYAGTIDTDYVKKTAPIFITYQ